jgi:rRNA-processing protein FCF1
MKVIIDTNALMAISEMKIDIFSELQVTLGPNEPYVMEGTITELNKIIDEQRGKYQRAAKLALAIIKGKVKLLSGKGDVDDLLIKQSMQGTLVLTQDQALKRKLKKPYLTIRQKKKIILID